MGNVVTNAWLMKMKWKGQGEGKMRAFCKYCGSTRITVNLAMATGYCLDCLEKLYLNDIGFKGKVRR